MEAQKGRACTTKKKKKRGAVQSKALKHRSRVSRWESQQHSAGLSSPSPRNTVQRPNGQCLYSVCLLTGHRTESLSLRDIHWVALLLPAQTLQRLSWSPLSPRHRVGGSAMVLHLAVNRWICVAPGARAVPPPSQCRPWHLFLLW